MYLIVVITLVVAVMGIFTMGANKQAAVLIDKQQPNVAQLMLQWHTVAFGVAEKWDKSDIISMPTTGCGLTNPSSYAATVDWAGTALGLTGGCVGHGDITYGGGYVRATAYGSPWDCNGSNIGPPSGTPCGIILPQGWQMPPYVFYSIAFQNGAPTTYYVLTFVPPAPGAVAGNNYNGLDNLCLPGRSTSTLNCPTSPSLTVNNAVPHSNTVNATFHSLVKQLKNTVVPTSLGTVTAAGTFITIPIGLGASASTLSYTIPAFVPIGSVGIITSFTPCSTC